MNNGTADFVCSPASRRALGPQGEWRLRDLREALRDNQVHAAGLARELHAAGDRLKTVRAERRAMEARYGRRALLMLARPGA